MKRLLRNKANFSVLEGFLSELLKDDIKINQILEARKTRKTRKLHLTVLTSWPKTQGVNFSFEEFEIHQKGKAEMIRNGYNQGFSMDILMKISGLTKEEIKKIIMHNLPE